RTGTFPLPVQWPDTQQLALNRRTVRGFLTGMRVTIRAALGRMLGAKLVSMGAALQGRLLKLLINSDGVELRSDVLMSDLIVKDGRVVGVIAERNGKNISIEA